MYCERCFRPTDEWVHIKDTGTINTYSISHVGTDARRLKTPILVAVVDLDGATPGMGILHNLGEVEPSKIKVGMRVRAVWKSSSERQGAITDIRYFKPIGDEREMPILEKLAQPSQARHWTDSIPLEYHYTAGVAAEEFGRELRDNGRFLAPKCSKCKNT